MASNFTTIPTTRGKESIVCFNFRYHLKQLNKSGSKHFVCRTCSASITISNGFIIKINNNEVDVVNEDSINTSHQNHEPLKNSEILALDFKNKLKMKVVSDNTPIQQFFQEEQSKLIRNIGNMNSLTNDVPQFYNIQSGLYKYKSKFIPPIPKTIDEITIKDDWGKCEDKQRRFLLKHDKEFIIFSRTLD